VKQSARLFNCIRCHIQVIICSDCDRGQIYCSHTCSQTARKASCRAAGKRYQNTHRRRLNHAARQHRYRQRQRQKKEIVTHPGSPENNNHDLLLMPPDEAKTPTPTTWTQEHYCHFCKKPVPDFLRRRFLGREQQHLSEKRTVLAQGP